MTIEGLGKKFQDARMARGLTLDEAARMTKIRPSRLAEIEADDFSQFPSLAYAKGFLLIYGKFLDVDVTEYMEAFETSEHVTVDGYSYLQDNPNPAPARTPIVRRRRSSPSPSSSSSDRTSLKPLVIGIIVIIVGFSAMRLVLNIKRIAPRDEKPPQTTAPTPSVAPSTTPAPVVAAATRAPVQIPTQAPTQAPQIARATPSIAPTVPQPAPSLAPTAVPIASVSMATPPPATPRPIASEPEVRRAEPVKPEDLIRAKTPMTATTSTTTTTTTTTTGASPTPAAAATVTIPATSGPNRVAIRPLKKTYIKVVIDNEKATPAFERWVSPSDGVVEFNGQKIAVRVLERDAVQIKKNGKSLEPGDTDVTVE